jgi:hypothetical protein
VWRPAAQAGYAVYRLPQDLNVYSPRSTPLSILSMSDREPPPGFPHLSTSVFLEQQVGDAPRPTKWPFHMFDCRRTADGNYIIQLVIPKGEPVPALSGITTLKRELTGTNNQTWKVTEHWLNHLLEVVRDRESSGTEPGTLTHAVT